MLSKVQVQEANKHFRYRGKDEVLFEVRVGGWQRMQNADLNMEGSCTSIAKFPLSRAQPS